MNKKIFSICLIFCLIIFAAGINTYAAANDDYEQVLIGFKNSTDSGLVKKHNGLIRHEFKHIKAISAKLKKSEINTLKNNPAVKYIEPDYKVKATAETIPWGITHIEAPLAQTQTQGDGIKVAVIDTGIDYTHPDLAVAGGYSAVDYTASYYDDNGHGTHVAGTIAAVHNDVGVLGVAPAVSLYAVKALDSQGSGYVSDIVEAIDWCIANGVKVINLSLGSPYDSYTLHEACDRAYAAGILIVAAAGNSGSTDTTVDNVEYPARYSSVMAVAATNSSDQRAAFSSTGSEVEIAAPGYNILSTLPGGNYGSYSGTSMAAPHVTGTAALVWAVNPTFSNADVRQKIDASAIDLGAAGRDNQFGYGLVDAKNALGLVVQEIPMTATITTDKSSYILGNTVYITVSGVDANNSAVSGASVALKITTPAGKVYSATSTTNTSGKVTFTFKPGRKDGKGTYTVSANLSKTGYTNAQCSTGFTVK